MNLTLGKIISNSCYQLKSVYYDVTVTKFGVKNLTKLYSFLKNILPLIRSGFSYLHILIYKNILPVASMALAICRRENPISSKGTAMAGGGGEVESLLLGSDKAETKEREVKA